MKLLPFRERDGGFIRRYREWRNAFDGTRPRAERGPAKVLGIDRLKMRAYVRWLMRQRGKRDGSSIP
jgi:hypothetical protein